MRLHHSQDDSTYPGYKLVCFVYMNCFTRRTKCTNLDHHLNILAPISSHNVYCIEGIEMRQLGCKVRRLLFLNRY